MTQKNNCAIMDGTSPPAYSGQLVYALLSVKIALLSVKIVDADVGKISGRNFSC
jgi:hypothetical protein